MNDQRLATSMTIAVFVVIIIVVIVGGAYFLLKEDTTDNDTSMATNTTATNDVGAKDPLAAVREYDGKILTVASTDGKVSGEVGIKLYEGTDTPVHTATFLKITDSLPQSIAPTGGGASYYLLGNHTTVDGSRDGYDGTVSSVHCNQDFVPNIMDLTEDLSDPTDPFVSCMANIEYVAGETDTFYLTYSRYDTANTFDYDALFNQTQLEVFDEAPFYEEQEVVDGYPSYGADTNTVVARGDIVAAYTLMVTE